MTAAVGTRKQQNHLGIEVNQGLLWKGWEPGREYTKHLVLKNLKVKTQKLKYSVPSTRFFSTIFPEPITLSAGTSFSLPITFRPLEKNVYKDTIRFQTNAGEFEVPICAVLPEYRMTVPELVDLRICAVDNLVHALFEIKNKSELETPYMWQVDSPFSIEPSEGVIDPHSSVACKVTFSPKVAFVYEAVALCKYGMTYKHVLRTSLVGIGKYPHLVLGIEGSRSAKNSSTNNNEVLVKFGQVAVGQTVEKWITVRNLSKVDVAYTIEYENGCKRIDSAFDCPDKRGFVPADTAIKLPVIFSPGMVNAASVEYFTLTPHASKITNIIKCTGSSKGPAVRLAAHLINFGRVDAGETVTKVLTVINDTSITAAVQFDIDCQESVFQFRDSSGKIGANSSSKIAIEFCPEHPINYHRRVACLVHNQAPIFVDLIGTCHTELGKPALLKSKHVIKYRRHVDRGLSVFPPEQLHDMLKEGKLEEDDIGALMYSEAEKLEQYCHPLVKVPSQDEYFNDGCHTDIMHAMPHISTDVNYVDFGQCTRGHPYIQPITVNVTNHTQGKISVVWMGKENRVFSMSPVTADISPLKSTSFRVTFKPDAPNQFYASELEGFAFYKSQRDYRLVEDLTHCPPWSLTVSCSGQTFLPNNMTFIPSYELDCDKLIFPAVNVDESAYRTLLLYNTGKTPIMYDIQPDEEGIFSVKPTKGVVTNGFQIFTVKCTPKDVQTYKNRIHIKVNADDENLQELLLWGSAEAPQVFLPNEAEIYFRPTCIGTWSQRDYAVKNVSRIPLRFEWKLTHAESKLLSVKPRVGLIQPNESQEHCWTFCPENTDKVILKPRLVVWGQGQTAASSGGKKRVFPIRAIGEGDLGSIKLDETYVDFGNVIVGTSARHAFTICNQGNCNLTYRLLVQQHTDNGAMGQRDEPCALELFTTEGVLPARGRAIVEAVVRPSSRSYYQFSITYQIATPISPDGPISTEKHLCHLLATGVYPTMAVTDARCYGSAAGISKKHLWNLFAIDSLNLALDGDPSGAELKYSVQTRLGHRLPPNVYTRAVIDLNFGAAPINSEDTVVYVMLENSGNVPVEFSFLFPSDLQIELEYWAETGDYDEDELHEMKVQDNQLFEVEPRKAKMAPGESQAVTFTYRHLLSGVDRLPVIDRLPVLLKVNRGREILLNFIGVTVEPDHAYLHYPSNKHTFTPVPIGRQNAPKQIYELYNGGSVPVKFEVDVEPLDMLRGENFDRDILKCLTTCGEILPGRHAAIEWEFTPLEARTYMVDVPIHVIDGQTALITFTGIGYDQRIMGDTMTITDQMTFSGVPSTQTVVVPGQTSFLSVERISFGNVPLFTRSRQVLFVINQSTDHNISFTWHVTNKDDRHYCNIQPHHGLVPPGESRMCRVMFTACDLPSFYDMDLVCEIVNEKSMDKYKSGLEAWDKEKERQREEFTITENDLSADCKAEPEMLYTPTPPTFAEPIQPENQHSVDVSNDKSRPISAGKLDSLQAICRSNVEMDSLPKYRTLPPIKQLPADAENYLKKFNRVMKGLLWERPSPPKPFLLHLGVTARTHSVPEFQANFPDKIQDFYIDRCLSDRMGPELARKQEEQEDEEVKRPLESSPGVIICTEDENDVIGGTLANLLRSILDDDDFRLAVEKIPEEPIPYFQQFHFVLTDLVLPSPPTSPPGSGGTGEPHEGASGCEDEFPQSPEQDFTSVSRTSPVLDDKKSEPLARSPESLASGLEPELERLKAATERQEFEQTDPGAEPPIIQLESKLILDPSMVSKTSERSPPAEHPQTPTPPADSPTDPGRSSTEIRESMAAEKVQSVRDNIKRLPEFGNVLDGLMENTLMNIITEAFSGDFSITSRPRVIALPPKSLSALKSDSSRRSSRGSKK